MHWHPDSSKGEACISLLFDCLYWYHQYTSPPRVAAITCPVASSPSSSRLWTDTPVHYDVNIETKILALSWWLLFPPSSCHSNKAALPSFVFKTAQTVPLKRRLQARTSLPSVRTSTVALGSCQASGRAHLLTLEGRYSHPAPQQSGSMSTHACSPMVET